VHPSQHARHRAQRPVLHHSVGANDLAVTTQQTHQAGECVGGAPLELRSSMDACRPVSAPALGITRGFTGLPRFSL
jgi:hypothetical protein